MDILLRSLRVEWESLLRLTPKLLLAILALILLTILGRVVARAVVGVLTRSRVPETHRGFFRNLTRWVFVLLGLIVGLNILGLKGVAASLVAGGGVTAVVLGFAFRGIGENFLAGFFLVVGRTFKVGDFIRSGEFEGQVLGIELRHTHIRTADGRDVFIPSFELFSNPLVNYTRDGLRRLSFKIGIDYADDIGEARRVLMEKGVVASGLALKEPPPGVIIASFAPSYVELQVFFWIDTFKQPGGLANVPTAIMEQCRKAILEAGLTVSAEVTTNIMVGGRTPVDVRVQKDGDEHA